MLTESRRRVTAAAIIVATATLLLELPADEQWWPQFRGPNASGVADNEAKPPVEFGEGKHQAWKVAVPPGSSSPVIWGDRLFLTAFDAGRLKTLCFRCSNGALLWEKSTPVVPIQAHFEKEGSPAAPSVATDGQHVVAYFGSFGVLCYDMEGNESWQRPLPVPEDPFAFGTGSSPIVTNDLVILQRDYDPTKSHLLALDLKTGEEKWTTTRAGFPTSYGTPVVWKHGEVEELVVPGSLRVCGYDFAGVETWTVEGLCAVVCTTPVIGPDFLYLASWSTGSYGDPFPEFSELLQADADKNGELSQGEAGATFLKDFFRSFDSNNDGTLTASEWKYFRDYAQRGKNALIAIRPGGQGNATATHVAWTIEKGIPYVPSPLYYRGSVYLVRDGGIASCFDAETGKPHYQRKRLGVGGNFYASPVAADGRIYVGSLNGELVVYAAGPEMKILAVNDLGERLAGTPAIVGNSLYVRTAEHLMAFR